MAWRVPTFHSMRILTPTRGSSSARPCRGARPPPAMSCRRPPASLYQHAACACVRSMCNNHHIFFRLTAAYFL